MGEQVFLVDTNVFLEVLLEQSRVKECLLFFERVSLSQYRQYRIVLTTFSLYSIGLKLEKHNMQEGFRSFLSDSEKHEFLFVSTGPHEEKEILTICTTYRLSFDDAHQYWAAKKLNAKLVSFDTDFDRTDLKRYTPKDILKELQ